MNYALPILLLVFGLGSCKNLINDKSQKEKNQISHILPEVKAEQLLANCFKAHGGKNFENAYYKFDFREKSYSFKFSENSFEYTKKYSDDGNLVENILKNDEFMRVVNGIEIPLDETKVDQYSNQLNSVIYFATLPFKLSDQSVNKTYLGQVMIKNEKYEMLGITFDQEGGGKDYDDTFCYWINAKTHLIDYLAYNYKTNGGGARFRAYENRTNVNGVVFQDYSNREAPLHTPLTELGALYENNQLKELSKINTENIVSMN